MTANECQPCCGQKPTLRVHRCLYHNDSGEAGIMSGLEYICRKCGQAGGVTLTEDRAREGWERHQVRSLANISRRFHVAIP